MAFSLSKVVDRDWIPRLRKCCCICSLQTGSLVIAWIFTMLSLIGATIKICSSPFILAYMDKKIKEMHMLAEVVEKMKEIRNRSDIPNPGIDVDPDYEMMTTRIHFTALVVILCGLCIVNILLLIGIHKKTHCLMLPWLIVKAIGIAISIYVLLRFIYLPFTSSNIFLLYSALLGGTILLSYFYLVVYSLFRDMKETYVKSEDNFGRLDEEV